MLFMAIKYAFLNYLAQIEDHCKDINKADDLGCSVIRSLNQIIGWRDKPKSIRFDWAEYMSHKLADWALVNEIELRFI